MGLLRCCCGGSGPPPFLPGCPCTVLPATLHQTVGPDTNNAQLQDCTYTWGPVPVPLQFAAGTGNAFISTSSFLNAFGNTFWYWFYCPAGGSYVVATIDVFNHTFGSLVGFSIGIGGNQCSPFLLQTHFNVATLGPQSVIVSG